MLPDKCLGFKLELVDEVTKIAPSAFVPFIGFFITLQNYVNAKLDKTNIYIYIYVVIHRQTVSLYHITSN